MYTLSIQYNDFKLIETADAPDLIPRFFEIFEVSEKSHSIEFKN